MKVTAEIIKNRILESVSHFTFEFNNESCGIDPIDDTFEMWYGEDFFIAKNIEEVMTKSLFNGKSLSEIADEIDMIDF